MTTQDLLRALDSLQAENPRYRLGGDGADGTCDCIGAIIGACRRCGVDWPGIHGSNWAARNLTLDLTGVADEATLSPGDLVYKAKAPGQQGYALPDRYDRHPDRMDYYHVGVVRQVRPLRIVHCTSPGGFTTDHRLGRWAFRGRLSLVDGTPCAVSMQDDRVSRPTLRRGHRRSEVAELQLRLRDLGFTLQPDGIFGPITQECVKTFQALHGLKQDGIVGPATWSALLNQNPNPDKEA